MALLITRKVTPKMQQWILFFLITILYMVWLCSKGSMIAGSGDAADCWHSITTWYSADRYGSYTLYKGFAAVYPYVWLYRMAAAVHINEFFFCMLYHAVLFAYMTVIGLPYISSRLTGWTPVLWQRAIVPVFFFVIWQPTGELSELMVDLPSCTFFVMAVSWALYLIETTGKRRLVSALFCGLSASLCANISGQYVLSAFCLIILAIVQIWKGGRSEEEKPQNRIFQTALLILGFAAIKLLNTLFMAKAVAPLIAAGAWIPSGDMWLQRGLLYFLDKNRYLYGATLSNPRGFAILQDICGSVEDAQALIDAAGGGAAGWTIPDFLNMVLHYPVDAVVQAMDKFFLSFSIDMRRQSVTFLIVGYSLFYIAAWNAVRRIRRLRDLISPKTLIILSALSSLIPSMVMTLEMRVASGAQSIVFGVALLCGSIPQALEGAAYRLSRGKIGQRQEATSASLYIVWFIFVLFCMMHMGTLYAQSDIGTEMLFKWW